MKHALIFGSRAKGNYEHGSDIDLAILKPEFTDREALRLSATLNQNLPTPYHYDVLAFSSLTNMALMQEIQLYGRPIDAAA